MTVNNSNEMTRAGYDALNEELEHLITVVRKENAERLKEAISLGDISENAEYDAAKDAQAETEERISEIEEILRTATIVEDSDDFDNTVQTGRFVKLKDLVFDEVAIYQIVGTTQSDPLNGNLSNASLVGQHIIGKKAGDVVEFAVPDGMAKYEILEVTRSSQEG